MKKYRGYLLVLLIAFCIQGCSKQQDVEDHSFVLAMGFERLNEKKVLDDAITESIVEAVKEFKSR